MEVFFIVFICILTSHTLAVMEQGTDDNGNIVWKPGRYRNRDVVPIPTSYDPDKKHKREADEDSEPEKNLDSKPSKKSFIKHFSLPFGAEIPFGYTVNAPRKGKKDIVARIPLEDKLIGDSRFKPIMVYKGQSRLSGRSKVPRTWGLTWEDPYPGSREDENGYERSNLEGVTKTGKISEEEFESGLMGRGLGGMKERAENEILMEKKFEQKISDESDVESENNARRRMKRFIFFPPHLHHYGNHAHYNGHRRGRPSNNNNAHPPHSISDFPAANKTATFAKDTSETEAVVEDSGLKALPERTQELVAANMAVGNVTSLYVSPQVPINGKDNMTEGEQRQFKQKEGHWKDSGAQDGDTIDGNENDEYEYQPQHGDTPDGEYDKQYPNGVDGSPFQYQNHNPHHNVFNQHEHNPYKMHRAHGDYKNIHPAHPFEEKMEDIVNKNYNFTQPLLDANKLKKSDIPVPAVRRKANSISAVLRHFLFIGGKIEGRHRDEDLSPAEIIV